MQLPPTNAFGPALPPSSVVPFKSVSFLFAADEPCVRVPVWGAGDARHAVPLAARGRRGRARPPRAAPLHALRHRRLRMANVLQVV